MKRKGTRRVVGRALTALAAVAVVVSGVTFAILQSQQNTLTGNTIETATANLAISRDGYSYATTQNGYDFANIIPGGPAVPSNGGYMFYLKNAGGTPLALKFAVSSVPTNPDNIDLSKVDVVLTPLEGDALTQSFTLQSLMGANAAGGLAINTPMSLASNGVEQYRIAVSMEPDALHGSGSALGNIDFAFTGATPTT